MNTTSVSLLERLQRPEDTESWDRFVKLYTPLLYLWARRLGEQHHDAADLVQEVFALLLRRLPGFIYDPKKRFRGWLWTVTVNAWRMQQRKLAAARVESVGDDLPEPPLPDGIEALSEAEYRDYLVRRLMQLMRAEFHPTTWQAFWECVTSDRPAAEVAAVLGMTTAAVYAAKSRVLRRLRQELHGLLD